VRPWIGSVAQQRARCREGHPHHCRDDAEDPVEKQPREGPHARGSREDDDIDEDDKGGDHLRVLPEHRLGGSTRSAQAAHRSSAERW
jgi:hypothetical protein